jgi:hypothetical protein
MRDLMSVAATAPAPGWYPDPTEPGDHLRWWDGSTWTGYTTDLPRPEPEARHPFADIIVDIAPIDEVPGEDFDDEASDPGDAESEPLDFAWAASELAPREERGTFALQARPLEAEAAPAAAHAAVEVPALPAYESPLAVTASPVTVRVEVPVRLDPLPGAEPEPTEGEPSPEATPGLSRRRVALAGTGAVVLVAAAAAGLTNLLVSHDGRPAGKGTPAFAAISAADKSCLKEWNTTVGGGAAQLRVTLGQFEGALARVGRVSPLPGTIMAPDSCALTVYDPATDTHAVFVAGVKGQDGYLDVTSYPRAKTYGWPQTASRANVTIGPDGSIRAL